MQTFFQVAAQVAGLGGVALVVFLSIARLIVGKTREVNQGHSFQLLNRLLLIAGVVTVLGIVAWVISLTIKAQSEVRVTEIQSGAEVRAKEIQSGAATLKEENERQKKILSDRAEATLAGQPLNSVVVTWRFRPAPPWAHEVEDLSFAATERFFYSEDHLGAIGSSYLAMIRDSLDIDNGVDPAVVALARGQPSALDLYSGDTREAIARLDLDRGDLNTDEVSDFGIDYAGPRFEVLLPLTADWSAALSLGKKADDPIPPRLSVGDCVGMERLTADLTSHGFDARIELDGETFAFQWSYDRSSLKNAVVMDSNDEVLHAGMPASFSLVIVHEAMERDLYLSRVAELFARGPTEEETLEGRPAWSRSSELIIVVNGRKDLPYRYKVTDCGTGVARKRLFEDEFEYQFAYTRFYCVR